MKTKVRMEVKTASSNAVGELGSGSMVNVCELLINAVMMNKPKLLTGLNQKVRSRITLSSLGLHGQL